MFKRKVVQTAVWERSFDRVVTPFEEFIHNESSSSLLLGAATVLALLLANSPWAGGYLHLLHTPIGLAVGSWQLEYSLHHWVNEGLMALFFFVVGLEIKREVLLGELSDLRQAALPVLAALGGMLVPALLYALLNHDGPGASGWGVPMATDIAFAVGVLVLLGSRVPKSLITFLMALAIADDLGAVVVIALFYTQDLVLSRLAVAGLLFTLLVVMNLTGIRRPLWLGLVSLGMWLAMLDSGVHATVAGILAAWTVPGRAQRESGSFSLRVRQLMDRFDAAESGAPTVLDNETQRAIVQALENGVHQVVSPLQRLEHWMHWPVAFIVIPVFALVNAGVPLEFGVLGASLAQPVTLGIMLGLVLGKLIGIAGVTLLAIRLGIGRYPAGTDARHIVGVGLLGGVGFTMSIFIAELGFQGAPELLVLAKTGVLLASLVAGISGYLWLRRLPAASSV